MTADASGMLTAVTLNTWKCDGDYAARLVLMTAEMARIAPDVAFLQECFAAPDAGSDTAAALAAAMPGAACAVAPARVKTRRFGGRDVRSQSGMAVLARGRILSQDAVTLPTDPADGERIAQVVVADIAGRRVLAVNLHLCWLPGRDALRRQELAELAARLPPLAGFDLVLMAGDFNCGPDSAPLRWLLDDSGLEAVDLCAAANAPFPTHGETTSGRPATRRIDYVFALGPPARRLTVAEAGPAFDDADPQTGCWPSDHVGIRLRLATAEPRGTFPARRTGL